MGAGGGGGFNNQTGPILVHIYPLFNNNLHVKYRSNLIRTFGVKIQNITPNFFFFGVMLGPYIKSRGTRGTKMSVNADLITVETYVQQGETFMGQNVPKNVYFGGPEGVFNDMYMLNKEAI